MIDRTHKTLVVVDTIIGMFDGVALNYNSIMGFKVLYRSGNKCTIGWFRTKNLTKRLTRKEERDRSTFFDLLHEAQK